MELAFKPSEKAVYSTIPEDKTLKQDLITYLLTYGQLSTAYGSNSNSSTTLTTVPAGYYFYLTYYSLSYTDTGAAAGKIASIKLDGGIINQVYSCGAIVSPPVVSISPSVPLKINEGQVIAVSSNDDKLRGVATIGGYLIEIEKINLIFR